MKNNSKKTDSQLLVPVIGIFAVVLAQTLFNILVHNIWINLTFGIISSVILSFVIYFILKKQN